MLRESNKRIINVITSAEFVEGSSFEGPKFLTFFFEDDLIPMSNMTMHQFRLTVEIPSLFPYTDNKMVPWNYNCNYVDEAISENILGIRGMTRNGRCYVPATIEKILPKPVEEVPKQKDPEVILVLIKG